MLVEVSFCNNKSLQNATRLLLHSQKARLDRNGNIMSKNVQYIKSETYLTELMEEVCEKLEDYAKAKYKRNGRLTILKMTLENGGMNPDMR